MRATLCGSAPAGERLGNQVQQNGDKYRADHDQNDIKQKPDQHRNESDGKNDQRSLEEFGRGYRWSR